MDTVPATSQAFSISQGSLLTFVRTMLDRGREDEEHPFPPGPWDLVIRSALERMHVFGPSPEPWAIHGGGQTWKILFSAIVRAHPEVWDTIGGGRDFGDAVALNPQPLPPRYAAMDSIANVVIRRVEFIRELAVMANGGQQGGPDSGAYLSRFADDFCGSEVKLKWPFPGPRPKWLEADIGGIDLAIMATRFDRAAKETFDADLRQQLEGAAGKLAEAALERMG